MIKNPKFYLDIFSYLLKGVLDDRSVALYKQYLTRNNIVNYNYVDEGGYLHRPPLIIKKSINDDILYDYYDYNLGLNGNITAFSKAYNGVTEDDIIQWEYRLDPLTPLTVHNYHYNSDGTYSNESIGFDTGCEVDGIIINQCVLHSDMTYMGNDYLYQSQCEIELELYIGDTTILPTTSAGVIDYEKSVNVYRDGNSIITKGPGFVKIVFDKDLISFPIRTDGFSGMKIGVRPDYTNVNDTNWLYVSGVMPYMEYSMGNPLSYNQTVSSVNYHTVKAKNGSDYSMTTRNKNSNRLLWQGNISYLSNLYGGTQGIATNGIPVHNGKRKWSLEFDEIMNFNTGDIEATGKLIPTNTDISAMPYSLSNVWRWDTVTDTENFVTIERTEDVLTNLFARTGGGRLPFIFQGNSDIDDYASAVLSNDNYIADSVSSASNSLDVEIEEVYL